MAIDFEAKVLNAETKEELAHLAVEILEDTENRRVLPERMSRLLDAGLDPNTMVEGKICVWLLLYGWSKFHLKAAKLIFECCGVPEGEVDGDTFFSLLRDKVHYNQYTSSYEVKLFLLCCAYMEPIEGLKMNPNLYEEMFSEMPYSGYIDLSPDSKPIVLTPKIFKEINNFEWCITMEEQKQGFYGCWRMHIFDKETRLEVATYPY